MSREDDVYEHYFRRPLVIPQQQFVRAMLDCEKVVTWLMEHRGIVVQSADDDPEPPVFDTVEVEFNGPGEEGRQQFIVPRTFMPGPHSTPENGLYFDSVSTGGKPYDLAVVCCLIIFVHHVKRFRVRSVAEENHDPKWNRPGNWPAARRVCQEVLGYGSEFVLPGLDHFGRMVTGGIPFGPAEYSDVPNVYDLACGWQMLREGGRVRVYSSYHNSELTPEFLLGERRTLKEGQLLATVEWLRRVFRGAPDLDTFLNAIENSGDLTKLSVYADRFADDDHPMEARLRRLLPKGWPGSR